MAPNNRKRNENNERRPRMAFMDSSMQTQSDFRRLMGLVLELIIKVLEK